ncbi:LADA_0H03994g1_1 [Lachancea dasiensis]|uniref:LADA_0H03994g1_1 n=1 Tax=Lachancea dasiensis TaxID=1072105 RepID=A0A1G4K0G9_9SACH|nr:LADA_0H03994g1_1 [Lachancea dasiensis]
MFRLTLRPLKQNRAIWGTRRYAKGSALGIDASVENNLQTETNRVSKTLQKFWKVVSARESGGNVTLTLDNKPIRTPLGNSLTVPKDRQFLALVLQNEWSNLTTLSIKPHTLPVTSIVSRCIDLEYVSTPNADGELVAKIGGDRKQIAQTLLRYLDTDTLLCLSPKAEYEGALRAAQDKLYLPVIKSAETFLSKFAEEPVAIQVLDADIHGMRGNSQLEPTRAAALKYIDSLSMWDLAVFEKTVLTTKSFICGLLLLQNKCQVPKTEMPITMEQIAQCATLEIIYQTERWGEVEDTHDVDHRDIRRNVNAACIVAYQE